MECARCHGLMVVDRFVDLAASEHAEFTGWRCVLCGSIVDPVITANRAFQPEIPQPVARRERAA